MPDRERLIVSANGDVHTCGVQYAGKRVVVPYDRDKTLLLVKEMAGKAWNGNFSSWKSTRATLHVYRILSEKKLRPGAIGDVRERGVSKPRREIEVERILDIELADIAKTKPVKPGT